LIRFPTVAAAVDRVAAIVAAVGKSTTRQAIRRVLLGLALKLAQRNLIKNPFNRTEGVAGKDLHAGICTPSS
jgi:hypothetical protein